MIQTTLNFSRAPARPGFRTIRQDARPPAPPPQGPPQQGPLPPPMPSTRPPARRAFDVDELDIDYLEVTGPCVVLPYLNKLTFGLGSDIREECDMLLVAKGPGYVYAPKDYKDSIIVQLGVHFGYPLEASDDDRSLLMWQRRRISGYDLAIALIAAGVIYVKYIDYAMKGRLAGFAWLDDMLQCIPEATVIVDVAAMTKPSTEGRVRLVRWTRARPEGCRGHNHVLYGPMQKPNHFGSVMAKRVRSDVADPTMLKCLVYSRAAHVFKSSVRPGRLNQPRKNKFSRLAKPYFAKLQDAFLEQKDVMGDMRTELRFRVRSFGEIPATFSRQFAKVWRLLDVVEFDV